MWGRAQMFFSDLPHILDCILMLHLMELKSGCSLDFRETELCLRLLNGDNGLAEDTMKGYDSVLRTR